MLLLAMLLMGTSRVEGCQSSGGGGGNGHEHDANNSVSPTFQTAPCPFSLGTGVVEGQQVTCGYATLPENHQANTGKTVKLAVAIFKAPQYMHSLDPAPVLRLEGGPGGSSLDAIAHFITAQNYATIVGAHDLILFDQRGTGYSTPSLICPKTTNALATNEQALYTCYQQLVAAGINLNNFNTIQNAGDVADLIHVLGYRQMTLYSVSYGTRLALTVMRLYPQVVRAVVLDSVYPLTHNRNELPATAQRAFLVLFQRCAENAACNAKYPHLQQVFVRVVNSLNAHPIRLTYIDPTTKQPQVIPAFTGENLVMTLFASLYGADLIPLLPAVIYQINQRIYTKLSTSYSVAAANIISWGLFYSTECSEDWAFLTQQDIVNSKKGIMPQIAQALGHREQIEYNVCQFWHVQPVPAVQKQPVFSEIPTLILAGEFDPITPPANGLEVADQLSHSYYFLFPGIGHGVLYRSVCADQMVVAFEANPTQQPDSSCIAHMSEPAFV